MSKSEKHSPALGADYSRKMKTRYAEKIKSLCQDLYQGGSPRKQGWGRVGRKSVVWECRYDSHGRRGKCRWRAEQL